MPDDFLLYCSWGLVGSHWGIKCKGDKCLLPSNVAHDFSVLNSLNFFKPSVSSSGRWVQTTVSTPKVSHGYQTLSTEPGVF